MSSKKSSPEDTLRPENWVTKIVSGPIARMVSRSDSSKPRTIDVMPTSEAMPMRTPRTVSAERSACVRMVSSAIRTISTISAPPHGYPLRPSASIGSSAAARAAG